jgi:hypothetical protein
MNIIRQYIAPLIAVIIFFIALVATSARIFLPADMAAPAPIDQGVGFNVNGEENLLSAMSPQPLLISAPSLA